MSAANHLVTGNPLDGKLLISVDAAARALSLSVRTVNGYLANKRLLSRKIGRRRLVVVSSLKAFASRDHAALREWSGDAIRRERGQ